jgi:glycerol-3-phosphate acyltransferase PlsY
MLELAAIVAGYLLGSIPAPYWIARCRKGIDIRTVGVRNMGCANVLREVGIREGLLAAAIDIGKGAATVWVARLIGVGEYWVWGAGLAAVVGHNFPVFLGFRGGRGVAAFIGVMAVISPLATLISLVVIGILWLIIRHMFTTLAIAAPIFIVVTWLVERSPLLLVYIAISVLFIVLRAKYRLGELKIVLGGMAGRSKPAAGRAEDESNGSSPPQGNTEG